MINRLINAQELDYRREAANGERFRQLYGAIPDVYVPRMDRALTTRRVLVMEWIEGERLRTGAGGAARGPRALWRLVCRAAPRSPLRLPRGHALRWHGWGGRAGVATTSRVM